MGLSLCKSCSVYPSSFTGSAPNPNPINFKIIEIWDFKNAVVAKIKYLDCTNFEGVKICVYENIHRSYLESCKTIDPHFSNYGFSPIARFKPTPKGIELALKLAESL